MNRSAKYFSLILSFAGLLLGATNASALTCNSNGTMNWNAAASWSCGRVPTSADDVHVVNNSTVTVNIAGAVALSLTIDTGGNASTLTFNAGTDLTVTNNVAVNAPTGGVTKQITVGSAALTVTTGNVTVTGGSGNPSTSQISVTSGSISINTGNLNISGGTANNAVGQATVTTGSLTVQGNATLTGGTVASRKANLTLSNTGSVTINGGLTTVSTIATSSNVQITGGAGAGGTITVNGAAGVTNGDTVAVGTGTFRVTNAAATYSNTNATIVANSTVSTGTLNVTGNLTNAAAKTMTVSSTGNITVGGVLTNNGTITLTTTGTVNANGDFTSNAGSTFTNTAAGNLKIGGNATMNGTFNRGTGTVTFNGAGAQTLGGTVATTFNNLTINKSSGNVTITSTSAALSPTVNGILNLTSGKLITTVGTNDIGLGTAGTVSGGSATSYVQGAVQKNYAAAGTLTFPVGDATNYTPVVITGTAGFTAGSLTISTTGGGDHPSIGSSGIDATKSVNRYWTLTAAGMPASTYTATFNYINGSPVDFDSGAAPANFIVEQWNGVTWFPTTLAGACTSTPPANLCEQITGETGFGDFAIGEPISGFTAAPGQFNGFDTTTPATSVLGMIHTKQAGIAFSVRLVHILNNAIDAAYNQAGVTVELLDSSDNSGALTATTACRPIGAGAGQWHPIAGTSQLVTFAAGIVNAVSFTVNNSYRDVRVHVVKAGAGSGEGCSTDRFAIRPQSLTVTALDLDWQNAGTSRALNNVSASGGNVHKASETSAATPRPFTLRATPVPATATNYDGGPTTVSGFPSCAGLGALCTTVGTLSFTAGSWTNGAVVGNRENATANYADAGAFNLQLEDTNYASVDAVDGTPAATLTIPATGTSQIGRFVPDYFDVTTLVTPIFRTFNVADAACSAGAAPRRTFTYIGQSFGYATTPQATITARNAAGTTTANYTGTLWKVGGATPSNAKDCTTNPDICLFTTSWSASGNSSNVIESYSYALIPVSTPHWDSAGATAAAASVTAGAGTGTITYGSSDTLAFLRDTTTSQATFTASITNTISVQDASESGVTGNGTIATTTTAAFSSIAFDAGNLFRYGRLRLQNANGSQLLAMPLQMETQYWNGTGYITNAEDNCTAIANTNVGIGNRTAGATTVSGGGTVVGGKRTLTLSVPAGNVPGAADIVINLGSTTTINSTNTCVTWIPTVPTPAGANMSYLLGNWCGANADRSPTARATFGIYKGADQFIYQRENF